MQNNPCHLLRGSRYLFTFFSSLMHLLQKLPGTFQATSCLKPSMPVLTNQLFSSMRSYCPASHYSRNPADGCRSSQGTAGLPLLSFTKIRVVCWASGDPAPAWLTQSMIPLSYPVHVSFLLNFSSLQGAKFRIELAVIRYGIIAARVSLCGQDLLIGLMGMNHCLHPFLSRSRCFCKALNVPSGVYCPIHFIDIALQAPMQDAHFTVEREGCETAAAISTACKGRGMPVFISQILGFKASAIVITEYRLCGSLKCYAAGIFCSYTLKPGYAAN